MTEEPQTAPYGTWVSPITPESLTENATRIPTVLVDSATKELYYIEGRPSEGGRQVIVKLKEKKDLFGKGWNARTNVQEYGGVPATIYNGIAFFSNIPDNRVYKLKEGEEPAPITPDNSKWRYAELTVVPQYPNILLAVWEDHTKPEPANVVNKLVAINILNQSIQVIAEGADFYAFPRPSPDGKRLAWIEWYHPDMPWLGTNLILADFAVENDSVKITNPKSIAGERKKISIQQPTWLSSDRLLFLSDETKYQNPWTYTVSTGTAKINTPNGIAEDFCEPAWSMGDSDYAPLSASLVVHASIQNGLSVLSLWDLEKGTYNYIPTPYSDIVSVKPLSSTEIVFIGNKPDDSLAIVKLTLISVKGEPTYGTCVVLLSTWSGKFPRELISIPKTFALPVPPSGDEIYATYYPPHNPKFKPVEGELPPALVFLHGGPTARSRVLLRWNIQFWTSRGWAAIDVNYGGSSGYGRVYMDRLEKEWGVVDINDTIAAVVQFIQRDMADSKRIAMRGESSSGLTTLDCLIKEPTLVGAATSSYGVSDLLKLEEFTHKFESHYLEYLLGGTSKEVMEVYVERSPITHADKIKTPLLILQGLDDAVVPPQQSETVVRKIQDAGGKVKYITFEGEGHGWRKAETIKAALQAELDWYNEVFGFKTKSAAL